MLVSQSSFKWRQANWRHIQILYGWFFFLCLAPAAWAQWAPTGYTGTINTPTADVLPLGGVSFGLSDNIPESKRVYPGTGYFGSTGLGLGVLPGLELSTRLAYDGDPDCDQRLRNCHAQSRDLSVGGKYRLPIDLPLQGRVALGFSDYGGSATQFRQNYGVWTSTWRDLDLSLGWGHIVKRNALLNGPFASATWRVSDQWRLSYESVREQKRAGVLWSYPLTPAWQWSMGYSRRLGANSPRQLHQMQLQLSYAFDRDSAPARVAAFSPYAPSGTPATGAGHVTASRLPQAQPTPDFEVKPPPSGTELTHSDAATQLIAQAHRMQAALKEAGFAAVQVGRWASGAWWIQAEPWAWRQSQHTAIAQALRALQPLWPEGATLVFSLSYAHRSHRHVRWRPGCESARFLSCFPVQGQDMHIEEIEPPDQTGITWWAQPQSTDRATLELELGPALRHTVGTELGLFDYSLALDAGWQVAWAGMPGWFAQGNYTHPWAHSSDFGPKGAFGSMRIKPGSQQSLISHVWQPTPQTYTQANIGYINREARGILLQGAWLDADRRLKFSTQAGRFVDDTPGHAAHAPLLVKARYDWVPMQWAMEVTRGRYMAGDVGWQLSSLHQFSRHRLEFYMRQSESPSMPLNRFAGFIIAIPIGPDRAWTPGPVSLRGRDLWGIGLQSKIGHNNTISTGYGEEPFVRHGLNDILDQDRRAPLGSAPAAERLNQALQTP